MLLRSRRVTPISGRGVEPLDLWGGERSTWRRAEVAVHVLDRAQNACPFNHADTGRFAHSDTRRPVVGTESMCRIRADCTGLPGPDLELDRHPPYSLAGLVRGRSPDQLRIL